MPFWNIDQVMNEAQNAAKMTRSMAHLVDTRGQDLLDLMGTFSSQGKLYSTFM